VSCVGKCLRCFLSRKKTHISSVTITIRIIFLNIDSYSGGVPLWSKGLEPQLKMARCRSEGDSLYPNGCAFRRSDSFEELAELEIPRELTTCVSPSSPQDGLLDVVSIRGTFHLGQIRVGLSNAQLLCQCREATVTLKKKIAIQIDGEPWRQAPSTLKIICKTNRATMLNKSTKDSGGVETEITKLLNWANESEVINRFQYTVYVIKTDCFARTSLFLSSDISPNIFSSSSLFFYSLMEEFSRRIEYKRRVRKDRGNSYSYR
jgi:hypothetical protein